jgi:septal ring factor EnvC (AmiA/AmiB activator)
MPCIFCVAVFMMLAGTVGAAALDEIEERLSKASKGRVQRTADSESVAKLEATVEFEGRDVPVAVTVYKEHARARIQVLTHDLTRDDAEKLENHIAEVLDLRILARSDPRSEEKVHEAFHESADNFAEGAEWQEPEAAREPPTRS